MYAGSSSPSPLRRRFVPSYLERKYFSVILSSPTGVDFAYPRHALSVVTFRPVTTPTSIMLRFCLKFRHFTNISESFYDGKFLSCLPQYLSSRHRTVTTVVAALAESILTHRQVSVPWGAKAITHSSRYNAQSDKVSGCKPCALASGGTARAGGLPYTLQRFT